MAGICLKRIRIMNKREISEIKKQFKKDNNAITRICGCYVDGEKNKKTELKEAFLSLSEEEMFKYFEIFRKSLSGTIGKNLMNMEFPLEQETEGGTQHFLMKLRESKLTDDALVESFYDKIIENYDYPENYYIILIHGVYDIPGKSSDGAEMFDASDEIYEHIMCCICPVKLSKAGLCYNAEANSIQDRIRDWIVELPDVAFLFPQFNDRSTDIHGVLYYSKNANELRDIFIDELLGCTAPLSAGGQRDSFNALVEDTLGDDCRYDTVLSIHEKLNDLIESQKDEPEPVVLTKSEVKRLFEECGVEDEKLQSFDEQYEITAGEKSSLVASNITNTKRFEIKTPDVVVHVDPERVDLVEILLMTNFMTIQILRQRRHLMENNRKLLFFDIDKTLLTPYPWTVPDSAKQALKEARYNGHLLFINSGRTYTMIPEIIKEMGFDGYVCGCGSQIYMNEELLFSSSIPNPLCRKTTELLRECRIPAFFERPDKILYDSNSCAVPETVQKLKAEVIVEDLALYPPETYNHFTFDKFLAFPSADSDMETFRKFADEHFLCFIHEDKAWELTQKNLSKATGIRFLADRLGVPVKDTYAFGDSTNDLLMLQFAGNSIAMGNSDPLILPHCTYQTTNIEDNGIANALKHFHLI